MLSKKIDQFNDIDTSENKESVEKEYQQEK